MKIYILLIPGILCCVASGCSTNAASSVAGYENNPVPNAPIIASTSASDTVEHTNADENTKESNGNFYPENYPENCAKADLILEGTPIWEQFEEKKPANATVMLRDFDQLHRNEKLPGHGMALVVFPMVPRYFKPGQEDPLEKKVAQVRQALKDAGFSRIYFYWREHGVVITPFPDNPLQSD